MVALVAVGAISTLTIKAVGPLLLGGRPLGDRVRGVLELMAPSLLAALIAIQALTSRSTIVFDERLAGVAVAGLALALRANIFLVVLLAALTTALLRA
jgi:hypothetical protein